MASTQGGHGGQRYGQPEVAGYEKGEQVHDVPHLGACEEVQVGAGGEKQERRGKNSLKSPSPCLSQIP